MESDREKEIIRALRVIPGVGKSIARDLMEMGITRASDLSDKSPGELYRKLCQLKGFPVDRCMLYVFRCAVYFVRTAQPEPELLKWWNWKDRELSPDDDYPPGGKGKHLKA